MAAGATRVSKIYTKEELCLMERAPESSGIVIFGASGDLAERKLYPSLFHLYLENLLPKSFYIVGVARTEFSHAAFRQKIGKKLKGPAARKKTFLAQCFYLPGDYKDKAFFEGLRAQLERYDQERGIRGHLFYLSTPPSLYQPIVECLGRAGLARFPDGNGWVRVVVEKPFGHDLASAEALDAGIRRVLDENQIYRIDHYLGKETVQNMLMFRFANAIFEPIWNNKFIDHIQITAAESGGVEHRAGYYEGAGALRDMFQNHLFQLLSLVAMEPPCCFEADAIRDEKGKVLAALKPISPADMDRWIIRGQYAKGASGKKTVPGYRQEPNVAKASATETFAAMRVEIDNWRWQGVPIYLRSGKRLPERVTDIAVRFKHVPSSIFKPLLAEQLGANVLHFRIQPDEGIALQFEAKHPGPKLCLSSVRMEFNYTDAFGTPPPEAYARLFLDVLLGDSTLFAREDWLRRSWRFLTPVLERWADQKSNGLQFYPSGSWGPEAAEQLLTKEGRQWLIN